MSILHYIFLLIIIGLIVSGICLLLFTKSNYEGFGNYGYKCTPTGCIKSDGGEFYGNSSETDCKNVCKSWVKENNKCQLVVGSRWNSYSLKSTCEKN